MKTTKQLKFNVSFIFLLSLIIIPAGLILGLEIAYLEKRYEQNKKELQENVEKAFIKARDKYLSWNQHTSNLYKKNTYDSLYMTADSSFQVIIAQTSQHYPLLDFKPDTTLPHLRKKQFLEVIKTLEKTRLSQDKKIKEVYVLRAIQLCKDCDKNIKSIAQIFPLDSLIKKALEEKKIDISGIKIAFFNVAKKQYTNLPIGLSKDFFDKTPYNFLFNEQEQARLIFQNENQILYYRLIRPLVGTLIVLFISLGCAVWATIMLYKQKKLTEMKNDFINNVTHEFKTPIATITFAIANIENEQVLQNPDFIKKFTQVIKEENKRLNLQVEKVLQAAIIDQKALELQKEKVNLHNIIENLVNAYSLKTGIGNLHKQLYATNATVEGDSFHLANAISNLLDNALKYSNEQINIIITTENVGKMLKISIQDSGIGISSAQQKLIFEKFYRVPTGNLHNVKGFGLGLSYVKAIVEQHNGYIKLKSKINEGSIFHIFLPNFFE